MDGSVLVMKIPKHVTYEEVFPKAKQAMKPKAMKVMRKKSFMKVINKKKHVCRIEMQPMSFRLNTEPYCKYN